MNWGGSTNLVIGNGDFVSLECDLCVGLIWEMRRRGGPRKKELSLRHGVSDSSRMLFNGLGGICKALEIAQAQLGSARLSKALYRVRPSRIDGYGMGSDGRRTWNKGVDGRRSERQARRNEPNRKEVQSGRVSVTIAS